MRHLSLHVGCQPGAASSLQSAKVEEPTQRKQSQDTERGKFLTKALSTWIQLGLKLKYPNLNKVNKFLF